MIKHKQHTDPDQSERLIKAGLDSDTADMHYRDGAYHQGKPDMNTMAVVTPIWSAYALRKFMPTYISKDLNGTDISYRIGWEPTQRGFVVFYVDALWHAFTLVEFECEDLNDGHIDMMCWLLDNGYVVTTKMRKAYTEDEKTEIAELYRDGRPVNEIASKFGRKPDSIYKLLSAMGVKRNQKREYEKPEVIAGSDASDQPKAKRECTLKKPWYLKPQVNIKDKK